MVVWKIEWQKKKARTIEKKKSKIYSLDLINLKDEFIYQLKNIRFSAFELIKKNTKDILNKRSVGCDWTDVNAI